MPSMSPMSHMPTMMSVPSPILAPQVQAHALQHSMHSPHYMQYYSPYEGETVLQRLGKHLVLRLGQVFFHELSNFFGLWKWPPLHK